MLREIDMEIKKMQKKYKLKIWPKFEDSPVRHTTDELLAINTLHDLAPCKNHVS